MSLDGTHPRSRQRPEAAYGVGGYGQIAERPSASGILWAVFDGALNNRPELLRTLAMDDAPAAPSDAELALFAYARWGRDFPDRFIGDFACAIWDGAARVLMLTRDALGAQPLCFWRSGDMVFFASEPRGLLAHSRIPKAIDEHWIARWLALLPQNDTRTQYLGIERVPPGQEVLHTQAAVRLHRFWQPENLAPLRFAHDSDYIERFHSVLDEAVRCRIDTLNVGSHLSGGLDSSSVTAAAARLMMKSGRRLAAFTAVPAGNFESGAVAGKFCDEGPAASLTAAAFPNIDHVLVSNQSMPVFDAVDAASVAMDAPVFNPSNEVWLSAIGEEARHRDVGVMLTGQMGNMTISYDGLAWLPQLARQGHYARLLPELLALHRTGSPWLRLANHTFAPLLPSVLRRHLRAAMRRPESALEDFSAINVAYAERLGVEDEARSMGGNVANSLLGRRNARLAVIQRQDTALYRRGFKRRFGIDMVSPTADRRVVEFCLATPPDQFLRCGETRSLLRRAMKGILPDAVRTDNRRGLQAADWHVGVTAARAEMAAEIGRLESSPLGQQCLDLPRLRRLVENWPRGGWHRNDVSQTYQILLPRALATGRFILQVEGASQVA